MYLSGFLGQFSESQQRKPPKYVPNLQEGRRGMKRAGVMLRGGWRFCWFSGGLEAAVLARMDTGSFIMFLIRTFATHQSVGGVIREDRTGEAGSNSNSCFEVV